MTDVDILFSSIPVSNFDAGVEWYERLFGRSCDVVVHETEVMWRFSDSAWLYVIEDAARAGFTVVTLRVLDLDQTLGELAARGLECGAVESVGVSGRKSTIHDADGNAIAFIEVNG